jgi:hypothetical protein
MPATAMAQAVAARKQRFISPPQRRVVFEAYIKMVLRLRT